ncbi:MAG: folate-binding protein [Pseudomonadota bacterium]
MQSRFAYLAHRGVLALQGPDTLELLERLVTCNTVNWPTGEARYGALLTPQGKIIADFLAVRTEDGVLLEMHKDAIPDFMKRMKLFRLRASVDIARLENVLIVAGIDPADHGLRPVSGAQLVYVDPRYPGGRLRAIATETEWRQFHGHEAEWSVPIGVFHEDRISACVPEFGEDFGATNVFPADVNMDRLGGLDYKKGCFVGQEVVSRMFRKGGVRKRTVLLDKPGLMPGFALESPGGAALGQVTSASETQALAILRLDRLAKLDTRFGMIGPDWAVDELESARADD